MLKPKVDSTAKTTLLAEEQPDMELKSWLKPYMRRLISSERSFCSRVKDFLRVTSRSTLWVVFKNFGFSLNVTLSN